MNEQNKINVYGTSAFTSRFMPSTILYQDSISQDYDRFLIMRIEDMYPHIKYNVPPSRSLNDVILFISDGIAHMNIGSKSYTALKGSILYIPSGQIFSFEKYNSNKFTKGFLVTLSKDILTGKLSLNNNSNELNIQDFFRSNLIKLDEESFDFAEQLLERILKENANHGLMRLEILRSYFVALICEMRDKSISENALQKSLSVKLVADFIELVTCNFKEKKSIVEYAKNLNISTNHLSKVVKKFTGRTPSNWIDESLIAEAKVLLFQTKMNINEISFQLGITDPSYFSRLFKKHAGITPLSFRDLVAKVT